MTGQKVQSNRLGLFAFTPAKLSIKHRLLRGLLDDRTKALLLLCELFVKSFL
jgi:hypothetical protein